MRFPLLEDRKERPLADGRTKEIMGGRYWHRLPRGCYTEGWKDELEKKGNVGNGF